MDIGLGVERTNTSFRSVPYRGSKFLLFYYVRYSEKEAILIHSRLGSTANPVVIGDKLLRFVGLLHLLFLIIHMYVIGV